MGETQKKKRFLYTKVPICLPPCLLGKRRHTCVQFELLRQAVTGENVFKSDLHTLPASPPPSFQLMSAPT